MKPVAKKSYREFRGTIPNEFIITRGPQKGAKVRDFRETVGTQVRLFRSAYGGWMDHRVDRDTRWRSWLGEIEFDSDLWEVIRKIGGDDVDGLADRQSNIEYYVAIYYRLHAFLEDSAFSDEIDRLVFGLPLRDRGDPVFVFQEEGSSNLEIDKRVALLEDSQKILVKSNANLNEQLVALTAVFRHHLKNPEKIPHELSDFMMQAEGHVARSHGVMAERVLLDAIDQISALKIEPEYERIAKIHIDRARNFLLAKKQKHAISAYYDAIALPMLSDELRLYCELCSFAAISFDSFVDNPRLRLPARLFVFEDKYIYLASKLVVHLRREKHLGPLIPRMNEAVQRYFNGENYRGWTMLSEDAGDILMAAAQSLDEVILADLALLGFEYMAMSYYTSDDPIDVEITIKKRLRAIHFLNGRKNPTRDQLDVSNIYWFV